MMETRSMEMGAQPLVRMKIKSISVQEEDSSLETLVERSVEMERIMELILASVMIGTSLVEMDATQLALLRLVTTAWEGLQ
jgi:hypothetical protein